MSEPPTPALNPGESHRVSLTHPVAMIDVDLVQINFSTYFRWMDLGYHALLRSLGHPLSEILADGHATPVVDVRCSYHQPVSLDDVVDATASIDTVGRTSYSVRHEFRHEGISVATGHVTHVWIAAGPPPASQPLPDWIREAAAAA